MARMRRAAIGLTATLALARPASAAPFKCPRVGGNFTFGLEANLNSLGDMISGTNSTNDVALNIFEQLITRDEKNWVIPDIADSISASADGCRCGGTSARIHRGHRRQVGRDDGNLAGILGGRRETYAMVRL